MNLHQLLDFCLEQQPWLLDTLQGLVRLESPSLDKAAVDRCGVELERHLRALDDARVARLPQEEAGDHLRAELGEGPRQILMLTHFDTVWPLGQLDRMPIRLDGGWLYGPGVYDMKGGIAIALLALRALQSVATRMPHVVVLCTTDEETGSATSRSVIEDEARRSDAVLVLEPSMPDGGQLKTARKGCAAYELRVRGIAAHSGEPHKGTSALLELADQLLEIERLGDMGRGLTITPVMAGGGERANVVPEDAWALLDVRMPRLADAAAVEHALRALRPRRLGAHLHVSGLVDRPPLERTPGVVRLFEMARHVGAELGLEVQEATSGGVSDGNFTAALGVPTLDGLGAVGAGAHAADERVQVDALAPRAALVAGLLILLTSSYA